MRSAAPSNALRSDVAARAERRRLRTSAEYWEELAHESWTRGQRERAANDLPEARRWLDRARRLAPKDPFIQLSLATVLLELGEAGAALPLFRAVADTYRVADAWLGLAAAALATGNEAVAREATESALRSTALTPSLRALADVATARLGLPGWCGIDADGEFHAASNRKTRILLDGVRAGKLPPGWREAARLDADSGGTKLLGSPLSPRAMFRVEGMVAASDGGIEGWAWHPAFPERNPTLSAIGPNGCTRLLATLPAEGVAAAPLARPRRFTLARAEVAPLGTPLAVTDALGRPLLGSPVDPLYDTRPDFQPRWTDQAGTAPATAAAPSAIDIVIPVFSGAQATLACLQSVLATIPAETRVHIIDDASPDADLVDALQLFAQSGRVDLVRHAQNRGFPAAANTGLRAARGRDVVLLNSDTLVPRGWLDRLQRAAYASLEIGTVTPLSNDATVVSYPDREGGNAVPDLAETNRLDRLAQQANKQQTADLPVGVGFCLYIRRDCLEQVGLLREDLFAQGYGEENDFCLRARHLGWRNVAALDVFVSHAGAGSFGDARAHLIARNTAVLNRLHPGYDALIEAHLASDPLHLARRRMDERRWAAGRSKAGCALLITHGGGGGVDDVVRARAKALSCEGKRPIVLRAAPGGCRLESGDEPFPNLVYSIPSELPALAALLRRDAPVHLELHHLLGHRHEILELADLLDIPIETWVHDYAAFCPRIALVSREPRYCGEPDITGCEDCIADLGSLLEEEIGVRDLVRRSAADLRRSRRVVVPSRDADRRLRRHFAHVRPEVIPWEDDASLPPPAPMPTASVTRVCIVGAIGVEKGYDVLLGCARDAARRGLPLEFVVCGYTSDDARLLAAGPVFITGEYRRDETIALISAQAAQLAFIPSVWPETWCFALSRAWQAGLMAVVFDLGAQAERIRATGRGWLLPLGLSARSVNDALLSLAPPQATSQSPPRSGA